LESKENHEKPLHRSGIRPKIQEGAARKSRKGKQAAFFQNSGIFARKFKISEKIQHLLKYRRNSDKISSRSEQKSMKRIKK